MSKRVILPSSIMNPKPMLSLNHFTVSLYPDAFHEVFKESSTILTAPVCEVDTMPTCYRVLNEPVKNGYSAISQ